MRNRLGAALAAGIALTVGLSGCVVFKGPVTAKQTGKRAVTVTFKLCNSDEDPGGDCPSAGNSGNDGVDEGKNFDEQVLLGFRVPKGTSGPARITSATPGVSGSFRRRAEYGTQLGRRAPTPKGHRWLGYSAPPFGDDGGPDGSRYEQARFRVRLRLPRGFDGAFKVRPVVGWADEEFGDLRCGPDPFEFFADGDSNDTICIDSPTRRVTRKSIRVKID